MKNLFNNIYFFVLFLFFNAVGYAQLYPVQLTPVFNSPYSVKISDYATSMDTKMQLLINPTDISISQRRVRLKLYIQGNGLNIQTSDYAQEQRPIYINGGELQTLTNVDIASLFRLENLQGMTPAQYANPLPEGMYNFCFEMYDFVTNQKISQKSCANLYLILNDPPLLNTPQKNEQIASTEFPNILFTWTPRQINATNISYKFELKQLLDPTLDPQIGFQMSPTLYEETLYGTAVLYNLSMPILTPGLRYAWRVRAISTTGLSENSVFKNDGYSEIYSFKYTASCAAPTFLLSEAQSSKSVKITWEGIPEHTRYQVQYKKQDVRNAQWFSSNSLNRQSLITNLEPGVTYEFRVGSSCDPAEDGVQSFTYSNTSTFTTPTESNGVPAYNCGIVPQINIQNQKPLTNLIQSETFKAGDFPVTILELQGKNSPYSGRGYIIVPYLADTKIAVEFKDIVINTDYQLISGVVETSYNPDWKNVTDVEDFTGEGKGGQIEEKVPFVIKDIVINANGDIVVNGENGEQITIPGGKDTVITDSGVVDKDGKVIVPPKVYTVDSEGNGSNQGVAVAEGGKPLPENTDGVDKSGQATGFTAKGISIAFSGNGSKYAFDVMPDNASAALKKMYAKAGDNVLPYKAVLNGDSDTVIATVKLTDSNIKLDSIVFKTQNGAKIDFKRTDNVFVLTVKGNLSYAEEEILATVKQGKKWQVIGAFMLVHISSKDVNVALVPTYDNSENRLNEIVAKTQEIYSKIGVKINFKKEAVLNIDNVVSGSVIQTEKNTITSTYSAEQLKINALYKGVNNSYVLFVTNKKSSKGQDGYMRLNGQFGYIFPSDNQTIGFKTPAHELGHGIFKLEHPFETYKTSEKGTDFLMDSNAGTILNHMDWKQINDPAFKLYAFQSQSSGELASGESDGLENLVMILKSLGTDSFIKCSLCAGEKFEAVGGFDGSKGQYRKVSFKNNTYICLLASLKEGKKIDIITDDILVDKDNIAKYQSQFANLIEATKSVFENKRDLLAVISNNTELVSCDVIYPFSNEICSGGKMVDDQTRLNISKELDACYYSEFVPKVIAGNLKEIARNSRNNQGIEFVSGGKVYKLNGDNAEEVKSPLSDDDIRNGKWTDETLDVKIRITQDKNGVFQYQAVGIRSNLPIFQNKKADLVALAKNIETKANAFLNNTEHRVTNIEDTPAKAGVNLNSNNQDFADGDAMNINQDSKYVKIIHDGIGLMTTLLESGEVEENTYLNSSKTTTTIHAPGLVTASVEVVATKVTDLTSMGALVYDLAVDKQARTKAYTDFLEIKNQVGSDPKTFLPILGEVVLNISTGNSATQWQETLDKNTDIGKKNHLGTRGVENAVITVVAGSKIISELPEISEKLVENIKKVKNISEELLENLADFTKKTLSEKLEIIANSWKKGYPDIFKERRFFEDLMGEYRYTKASGWEHTADISDNFKAVDFYKGTSLENNIFAETAVSMKTTISKDVDSWLASAPVKKNIEFLEEGLDPAKGIVSNGKTLVAKKVEIHIYMPKDNITDELRKKWMKKLKLENPKIEFEIKAIEDFVN
ncbi:fibronectin type III domain-containing protein [Flavobacterium sp. IB48]|uniref:fibronectin type III domain-containing protein n=1 Tax=Flavobacterium sp. IB48 TaxID=2779375 RepID=UPI0018E7A014|nr:fibronectin type III domain-containing protein [Flavobacterium sp. IB48]MBJ2124825.1 fibronectin type III domain-containing protein [Flavobacterium sp. IB48]